MGTAANNKMDFSYVIKKRIQTFGSEHLKGKDYLGDLDIGGRVILKLILRKWV
jgi:hypothetical protein